MPQLPPAPDPSDCAKAGFRPDPDELPIRAFEESLGRHDCIFEPDPLGPAPDHARDAAFLSPSHPADLRLMSHARSPFAGARRFAASRASRLTSTKAMPRRPAPSTIRGQ